MAADQDGLADLIERSATGDRDAFRALYEQTAPRMLGAARRVLGRQDLAEEAVQEAYVSIWERADSYRRAEGAPLAWMSTIVRRRAIDRLRASPWLKRETGDDALEILADMTAEAGASAEGLALRECLERLDDVSRRAILSAYVYGMTHQELSRQASRPLGTVKSLIRRGLIQLKRCLDA